MVSPATTSAISPLNANIVHRVRFQRFGILGTADPRNGIADGRFRLGRLVDRKNARCELYGFRYAR